MKNYFPNQRKLKDFTFVLKILLFVITSQDILCTYMVLWC